MEAVLEREPSAVTGRVKIVEYTDPYSVWCWGCEPALRRIAFAYGGAIDLEYRMGGLFEDFGPMREYWTRMSGGHWKEAVHTFLSAVAGQHRMPMDPDGMMDMMDDFRSTYPACIAVKAADRQGPSAGWRYLRRLREAALVEGRPIHHRDVQLDLAEETGLNRSDLANALDDGAAERAFREDLEECRALGIAGFPTFTIHRGLAALRIEGYQPWDAFEEAIRALDPSLTPNLPSLGESSVLEFLGQQGRSASREIAVVFDATDDESDILLDDLEAKGLVTRRAFGSALLWEATPKPHAGERRTE